eukprot:CAMPEP_0202707798 /NCGR_PEP_ID=MMETSP1385-20130828/20078_1 /ASSEMBLY_ACC=CAM_ASM_000861 /TAXON_ID=933848 /ORGANISM="Elphidium margaritaceum" /LENGTH=203 /DNA_ID=CAMNT_0049366587 /DNA_START=236 /DNA_END=847 /DNA_ORIENTATION=+
MAEIYPDTEQVKGQHPFMMSFCHGANISDTLTHHPVPQQEELMFVFPVIYRHDQNDTEHLCSYIPVLYLNSTMGVVGGLFYGLRKEYKPSMVTVATTTTKSWLIPDTINASFAIDVQQPPLKQLSNFFAQTFENPFVSISYPPFEKTVFYQAKVYANDIRNATGKWQWMYKNATISNANDSPNVFAKYWFTMSWPMNYEEFFG